ncbi:MAG: DUF6883 domain-containing protein [Dehalococcoidia bacterium]
MKLPNADQAVIAPEKLRDYLLSPRHPVGRFKAAFFARLGYTEADWAQLDADLRTQHLALDAEEAEPSRYGRKFTIIGPLTGPENSTSVLVSIWVIRHAEDHPRFVTAYPGRTA